MATVIDMIETIQLVMWGLLLAELIFLIILAVVVDRLREQVRFLRAASRGPVWWVGLPQPLGPNSGELGPNPGKAPDDVS